MTNKSKKDELGITLILIGMILILFGIIIILLNFSKLENSAHKNYNNEFFVTETQNCDHKAQLYYTLADGRNIYTYCLTEIKVKNADHKESTDLKELLSKDANFIDNLIKDLTYVTTANDGGSTIHTDNNLTILNCHTLAGNTDIYIGPKGMTMENGFCTREVEDNVTNNDTSTDSKKYVYDCEFSRTYNVVNTLDGYAWEIPEVSYIVVDEFQNHLVQGLMLPVAYKKNLEAGKFYVFTYHLKGTAPEEIKDLADLNSYVPAYFANNQEFTVTITDVKEASKTGLNQIMDDICKYDMVIE